MKQKAGRRKGITLIELVVTMAIVGIVASLVFYSDLWGSRNKKQVQSEAQKLIAVIKEAQTGALTGKVLIKGDLPCSYRVEMVPGADRTAYRVRYEYRTNPAGTCDGSLWRTHGNYNLVGGVEFSASATYPAEIVFDIPFGGTENDIQGIVLAKGDITHYVCVCRSGKVVEKGSPCDVHQECEN